MNESKPHIQLKFDCQEDPESMTRTTGGEFCHACQKEVIDFTKMSISEIQKIRASESEICGKFRVEQLRPELHPIEIPKVRSLAFLSTILLSLNFSSASAQSSVDPKVEQSQGASNAPNLTPEEAKEKAESGQHISMSKADEPNNESSAKEKSKIVFKSRDSKQWFWSKRFPFLHRNKRHARGAMGYRYKF